MVTAKVYISINSNIVRVVIRTEAENRHYYSLIVRTSY